MTIEFVPGLTPGAVSGAPFRVSITGTSFQFTLAPGQSITSLRFTDGSPNTSNQNQIGITAITANVNCFGVGAAIATPNGARPAEDLQPGDLVLTAAGCAVPVTWLGRRSIDAVLSHPAKVNPIRITAGALGHGLPLRDLRQSADHAIFVDGLLINAGGLVNARRFIRKAARCRMGSPIATSRRRPITCLLRKASK